MRGGDRPSSWVIARKRSSSSLLVPALPVAWAPTAACREGRWCRPLALWIAASGGAGVVEVAKRRLVDHVRQLVRGQVVAQVHQRARHRGHRNVVAHRGIARIQAPAAVQPHARQPPLAGRQHVDPVDSAAPELPQHGSTEVTEHGALPRPEHRRHPPALLRKPRMPDRVHTTMHPMQPSTRHPPRHRRIPEPRPRKLSAGHEPMLTHGERRQHGVHRGGVRTGFAPGEVSSHTPQCWRANAPVSLPKCAVSVPRLATESPGNVREPWLDP